MEKFSIKNKLLLAPMVRINQLPFRLLSLNNGADIVYTEEIIAAKLVHCEKVFNKEFGTNDYISAKDQSLVLRTHVTCFKYSLMRKESLYCK
jgi:tRNA-dihydrouridine synthase 2